MRYITVKLTTQQMWELKAQVHQEIRRLELLFLKNESKTFRVEIAFQKRLLTTLAKAKSS